MSDSDNDYLLCYLAAWMTDRIVTQIANSMTERCEIPLCSYEEIKSQANIIYNNFQEATEIEEGTF